MIQFAIGLLGNNSIPAPNMQSISVT